MEIDYELDLHWHFLLDNQKKHHPDMKSNLILDLPPVQEPVIFSALLASNACRSVWVLCDLNWVLKMWSHRQLISEYQISMYGTTRWYAAAWTSKIVFFFHLEWISMLYHLLRLACHAVLGWSGSHHKYVKLSNSSVQASSPWLWAALGAHLSPYWFDSRISLFSFACKPMGYYDQIWSMWSQ